MPSKTSKERRILLVDDHAAALRGLTLLLRSAHPEWDVATAHSATQSFASIHTSLPDVILMDYRMPRIDGLQAARRIRKEWPEIRVVMLSLSVTPELHRAAIECGCLACIEKADAPSQLLPLLERLLK